jgi:beta-glucosidase
MVAASGPRTAMGWEVHPDGLADLLLRLTNDYKIGRIHVTESGSAWQDELLPGGQIEDKERTSYLEDHIAAALRTIRDGVPLAGYFAWSLLDNFEWAYGYAKRFGLVHVDYETQQRTVKLSGHRYAETIRAYRNLALPQP